jgi:hypothetical protein
MPDLLHELWEDGLRGEFGPVSERSDQLRASLTPKARKVFEIHASSWHEALRLRDERLDNRAYPPVEGHDYHIYTDEEAAKQRAYLAVRNV